VDLGGDRVDSFSNDSGTASADGFAFGYARPLEIKIGDTLIETGRFYLVWCSAARVDPDAEADASVGRPIGIVPVDGAPMVLRLLRPEEVQQLVQTAEGDQREE
jgi:hypothetical protein